MKAKFGDYLVRYTDGSETMFAGIYDTEQVIEQSEEWEVDIVPPSALILGVEGDVFVHKEKLNQILEVWNSV